MKKLLLRNPFFSIVLLWFCAISVGIAQTPAADIDSITEDSYRRMLERQVAEQESDSLITNYSQPVLQEQESKEWHWWYYLLAILAIVVVWLVLRYFWVSKVLDKSKK